MEEENLKELVKEAKKLVNNLDAIIDAFDLAFAWISPKLLDLGGYSIDEVIGKPTIDFRAATPKQIKKEQREIVTSQETILKPIQVKNKKGETITITFSIAHFEFNGAPYLAAEIVD